MIDFETVGDLMRKAKIPQVVRVDGTPIISVPAKHCHSDNVSAVHFVFDRQGNLVRIDINE